MAISDSLPGVAIEILVDGRALKEYEDQDAEEDREQDTVIRYIEAQSGKLFAVSIELLDEFEFDGTCIAFDIYVDGTFVHGPIIREFKDPRSRISEGRRIDVGKMRKYRFTTLETVTDGKAMLAETAKGFELGTTKVKCNHGIERKASEKKYTPIEGVGIVSEKALKGQAITHSVDFTAPEDAEPVTRFKVQRLLPKGETDATFEFRYRSHDALKSTHIIPRTPSPPPLEDRDITTLSIDELRELQKRTQALRTQNDALVKIKRERKDDEEAQRPRKVARPSQGDTQLEFDDNGRIRKRSTSTLAEREVIEID